MFNKNVICSDDLFAPVSYGSGGGGGGGGGGGASPRSGPQTANSTSHNPPGIMGFDFNGNGSVMDEGAAAAGVVASVATGGVAGAAGLVGTGLGYAAASGR